MSNHKFIAIHQTSFTTYSQDAMPQANLSLEVEDTDHDLPLRIVTRHSERATVTQHGRPCVGHAHHRTVLATSRVLQHIMAMLSSWILHEMQGIG